MPPPPFLGTTLIVASLALALHCATTVPYHALTSLSMPPPTAAWSRPITSQSTPAVPAPCHPPPSCSHVPPCPLAHPLPFGSTHQLPTPAHLLAVPVLADPQLSAGAAGAAACGGRLHHVCTPLPSGHLALPHSGRPGARTPAAAPLAPSRGPAAVTASRARGADSSRAAAGATAPPLGSANGSSHAQLRREWRLAASGWRGWCGGCPINNTGGGGGHTAAESVRCCEPAASSNSRSNRDNPCQTGRGGCCLGRVPQCAAGCSGVLASSGLHITGGRALPLPPGLHGRVRRPRHACAGDVPPPLLCTHAYMPAWARVLGCKC